MKPLRPIVRLERAHKSWHAGSNKIEVLRGIDLSVFAGQSLAIVGPSGAGKSTLLHVLGLLTPLNSGRVLYDEKPISTRSGWWDHGFRRKLGYVFQDAKIIADLNVLENVCLPLAHRGIWPHRQRSLALDVLSRVGLGERLLHKPSQLSGGELMRVAIARALVLQPQMLLADEPTGTLDSQMTEQVADLLFETVTPERALVVVTHQESLAHRADHMLQMKDGRLESE